MLAQARLPIGISRADAVDAIRSAAQDFTVCVTFPVRVRLWHSN